MLMPTAVIAATDGREVASRRRRLIRIAVGAAVAALALSVVISAAGGIGEALDGIRQADIAWVGVALVLEAFSYVFMGVQLHRLVDRPEALRRTDAVELGLVIFGFGLLTPAAPAEGLTLAGAELRRRNIDMRRVVLALGFTQWFGPRSFYALASMVLVVAVLVGHLPIADVWPLLIVAALVVISLVVTARIARSRATAERAAVLLSRLQFWRPADAAADRRAAAGTLHDEAMAVMGSHANRVRLVALSVAATLADAGCLWAALRSVHISLPPDEIYLAVVVGSVATWLPLLPGGLGLVEAAIPTVLHHFGAPLDAALAATLIYRGLGTFLPALLGSVIVVRLRARRPPVPADRA